MVDLPMNINPRTGHKEYSDFQLSGLIPTWYRQWREYSTLSEDMIKKVVEELHTGPFMWPGTRIAESASKGIAIHMYEVKSEWKNQGKSFTGSQLYREARRRLDNRVREVAKIKDIEDPFAYEYYLTSAQRKKKRSY